MRFILQLALIAATVTFSSACSQPPSRPSSASVGGGGSGGGGGAAIGFAAGPFFEEKCAACHARGAVYEFSYALDEVTVDIATDIAEHAGFLSEWPKGQDAADIASYINENHGVSE